MTEPNPQPSSRAAVLMPAALDRAFDYLVPESTPNGALVEATLAGRNRVGVVWGHGQAGDATGPEISLAKLKPVMRVIDAVPPLRPAFMRWLDWVSSFTLAPRGAVLGLCGLSHAAKTIRKKAESQRFIIDLPILTESQRKVFSQLLSPADPRPKPLLLDGVTGSGKTEIYFHAIAATITADYANRTAEIPAVPAAQGVSGKKPQVLVLLPEISLTHQWLERFERTFGTRPVVWHSRMSPAAKARAWQGVARGEVQVVVGARSALFLPFSDLRLLVVDEEHDPSYKQEEGVLYHARDMAVARGHFEQAPVILVSATPSLETLENVREGKYRVAHLESRFGKAGLAPVQLIDLRNDPPERGNFLSPAVIRVARETHARGEQILFFLNRRGYAPLLLCRGCGHRFQCADCSAWLVVHGTQRGSLQCHHCEHKEPMPKTCPECGADHEKLVPCGPGVERVAEEVAALFAEPGNAPAPSLAILSSDVAIAPETWADIEAGKIDILVGTQMVAKGHHFPRLTLVVVVDADVGLDGADLRAGERSYQLLHQLGGRAGRADLPGQVLVQTYHPDHPVMKALVAQDRDRLMQLEAQERRHGNWPPFGQLAAILLDGKEEQAVRAAGQQLARMAPNDPRIRVLGPAPAPLSKLRGQYRYRLLLKAQPGIHLQRTLAAWLAGTTFKAVRVKVDVNPYYFL